MSNGFYFGFCTEGKIPTEEVPGWEGILRDSCAPGEPDPLDIIAGFHCTRPFHEEDSPHACRLLSATGSGRVVAVIVWGGE